MKSERKQAQISLRESEQRYRVLFDHANDAIFIMKDDKFLDCNATTLKMFGCIREQIVGNYPYIFSPPFQPDGRDSREKAFEKINLALSGHPQFFEWKHCRYDGTPFDAEVSLNSVKIGDEVLIQAIVRDITTRKQVEEDLRETQRKIENIIRLLPDATLVIDRDGMVIAWNRAMESLTGIKAEEMLGKGNYEYALPFYGERRPLLIDFALQPVQEMEKKYAKIQVVGDTLFGEAFTPALSSGNIHLSATASALRNSKGEAIGAIECIRDDTARKQAEKALRESEEKYRNILGSLEEGYHEVDIKGNFTLVSRSLTKILGYSESELIGMNYRKYMGELDAKNVFKAYNEVYRTGIPSKHTGWEFIRKDGTKIAVEGSISLVKSNDQVIGFRGIIRDVTDKKKAEDSLRESEEKYRTLLNNIEDGCYEVDLPGNFTFVNPSMTRILGYSEEELIGMNNRQYTDKENARKVFQGFNEVYKTGIPTRYFDWELIRKDGSKAFVGCSVSLKKDSSGKPIGFRGILHDITERKQMEEEIRTLSITDLLTGLYNRRGFLTIAEQQLKIAARTKIGLLLLFADLDGMKWINDNLGHKKGDEALIEAGNVLKWRFRTKSATDSDPNRPPNPFEIGHRFRSKSAGHSDPNRPPLGGVK